MLLDLSIPQDLKLKVVDFAVNRGIDYFAVNTVGSGRRFCNLSRVNDPLSREVKIFAEQCYSKFGISVIEETRFGNFIGVNEPGAYVHEHRDRRNDDELVHVRINFMLSKPILGGQPVINGKELVVDEDHAWLNLASEWSHSSTPVQGDKLRIVLSLGSYVSNDLIEKLGW